MSRCNLALLPFTLCLLSVCTFLTTYLIAAIDKRVYPYFPSVSRTIDQSPYIFSQLFNICSFLGFITFTVRFFQLRHDADWNERDKPRILKLNKISVATGYGAAIGASLTANFPPDPDSEYTKLHTAGVWMVLTIGVLYCILQTITSFHMKRCGMNTNFLFSVRLVISAVGFILLVVHFVLRKIANDEWNKESPKNHTHSKDFWQPKDVGYWQHATSSLSEWLLMIFFMFFLATFFGEFRTLRIRLSLVRYNDNPVPLTISDDDQTMRTPLLL